MTEFVWKLGYMKMDKAALEAEIARADEMYPSFLANCTKLTIEYSGRLTRVYGRCSFKYKTPGEYVIKLSTNVRELQGLERIVKTFRHEMAHAIEHIIFGSFGHSPRFKNICKRLGGSMNARMAKGEYADCAGEYIDIKKVKREKVKEAGILSFDKVKKPVRERKTSMTYTCKCGKWSVTRKNKFNKNWQNACTPCCGTFVSDLTITINK